MNNNNNISDLDINRPYVVGILSPSTTLYIDPVTPVEIPLPPSDLSLAHQHNRNTRSANNNNNNTNGNSFQITSVTVQGTRKNDDMADDSADDLDITDDISSDFLDSSSKVDLDGYHSEDNLDELASPCGPVIYTQGMVDKNMNLSVGVTPTFAALGPVAAGGVTMMTSKSESPVSAQIPIMNPLPKNWQRRFKVVKIMSSEPFQRGRWHCMDFKDPPVVDNANKRAEQNGGQHTPPAIQITNCDAEMESTNEFLNYAQVYEIPINQTFNGNFVMGNQQQMYGIILPQNDYVQPVTLVQDLSLQTTDRNFNNVVDSQSILVQSSYNQNMSPPATQVVDNYQEAVLNHINAQNTNWSNVVRSRNNSECSVVNMHMNHNHLKLAEDAERIARLAYNSCATENDCLFFVAIFLMKISAILFCNNLVYELQN